MTEFYIPRALGPTTTTIYYRWPNGKEELILELEHGTKETLLIEAKFHAIMEEEGPTTAWSIRYVS